MNEEFDPIAFLIDFAWANGADVSVVNQAKDRLNKLNTQLETTMPIYPVAYAKTNKYNHLYDLRLLNNPHEDQNTIIPLYSTKEEYNNINWKGYCDYGKFTE